MNPSTSDVPNEIHPYVNDKESVMNLSSNQLCRVIVATGIALALLSPFAAGAQVKPRIIGGVATSTPQPWVASLQYSGRHGCGGSLIAPQWVVTAAHCLEDRQSNPAPPSSVRLGSLDNRSGGQNIPVAQTIKHPSWNGRVGSGYDIALIRLSSPVNGITPIKIGYNPSSGAGLRLFGWGDTSASGSSGTRYLKQLDTRVISPSNCTSYRTGEICISESSSGSSCYGDSGGPAITTGDGLLVGATSRGGGSSATCGVGNGLYTSVPYYRSWIERYVALGGGTTPPSGCAAIGSSVPSYDVWQCHVKAAMTGATDWLQQRKTQGGNLAIVLDIDNTAINSDVGLNVGGANPPVLEVARWATANGYKILFVTRRTGSENTRNQLIQAGYTVDALCGSTAGTKEQCRSQLTQQGYTITANIGNRDTDFTGSNYEKKYQLPDYNGALQ